MHENTTSEGNLIINTINKPHDYTQKTGPFIGL